MKNKTYNTIEEFIDSLHKSREKYQRKLKNKVHSNGDV
jgi:ribosome-associated translation inhibitor RaiA